MRANSTLHDTIVACSTASGPAALALVRVSGPEAIGIVQQCVRLASGQEVRAVATHTVHYGAVQDARGTVIDRGMITVMHAPRTFTGYDTVELTVHNNPLIIEQVIELLCAAGARRALPGEFTRQAVAQGKIDVLQAEGIHDIITASSLEALQAAQAQTSGTLSELINGLYRQIITALAWTEASFEFLDDDGDFASSVRTMVHQVDQEIIRLQKLYTQQQPLRRAVRIALIGHVNAGKSSLLNQLVGSKRAIVSAHAGTTRDTIEVVSRLGTTTVVYIDTAGLRTTHDSIEQEGIERSRQEAAHADIIVLMYDASQETPEGWQELRAIADQWPDRVLVIGTKKDCIVTGLGSTIAGLTAQLYISTADPVDIKQVHDLLGARVVQLTQAGAAPYMLNERHVASLQVVHDDLTHALRLLQGESQRVSYELVAHHLNHAAQQLSGLLGTGVAAQAMDKVFADFCVGK